VTIGDVAARAGVSKGTVSKYFGGDGYYVSEDTRTRIAAAVAELDFQPNAIAQGLVHGRTHTIGVIVASVVNPLYAELVDGIDEVLGAQGYTLIMSSSEGSADKEALAVRSMRQRQVDGIVMASVTMDGSEVQDLVASGVDVVLASRHLPLASVDTVIADNVRGARLAVEHLAGHGHTRIGHLAGPPEVAPFVERRAAYEAVLAERDLPHGAALVVQAASSRREDAAAAMATLMAGPDRPTAVFVPSDGMALGALQACDRLGISVPEDVAIVGFDNVWVSRMPGIRLTTVDSSARSLGERAASILLTRIESRWDGTTSAPPQHDVLPARLVLGSTCGCPSELWES
jgi:LacI family transcriptional regulator/LacI family repressor for deo operon, udp, cdd, tsx, nupC, and nupG